MNTVIAPATEFDDLLHALARPSALTELAIAAACLVLAWLAVRLLRGRRTDTGSVWFGDHLIDGVLFPVLALALALAARSTMQHLGMPVAVFKVIVPVLSSLALIRLAVRVLSAAFPRRGWVIVAERTVSWVAWGGVVLWITGLLPLVLEEMEAIRWKVGGTTLNLRTLLEGGVTAVVVMIVALWISAAIEKRLLAGAVDNLSLRKIAANATRALLLFIGLLMALSAVGIDLTALSVLGGAVGVGLGFGLQKLAANYVSGFVILAERSLRIGDMVRVDNFEGRITDINTRYTVIRALNGRESIVPNELLITQRVENSSLADPRVLVQTVVQVAYGSDLEALIPALNEVVAGVPRVLPDPAPAVQLSAFAADGLELTVNFWIADPENGQGQVRSNVNLALLRALTERGIEIPFPQRVMHPAPATFGGPAVPPSAPR